jgi:hypothetical protein
VANDGQKGSFFQKNSEKDRVTAAGPSPILTGFPIKLTPEILINTERYEHLNNPLIQLRKSEMKVKKKHEKCELNFVLLPDTFKIFQ